MINITATYYLQHLHSSPILLRTFIFTALLLFVETAICSTATMGSTKKPVSDPKSELDPKTPAPKRPTIKNPTPELIIALVQKLTKNQQRQVLEAEEVG
jgi:hypothetical protein